MEAAKDRESATENRAGVVSDAVGLPANVDTVPRLFLDERLGLLPSLGLVLIPAEMLLSAPVAAKTLTLVLDWD